MATWVDVAAAVAAFVVFFGAWAVVALHRLAEYVENLHYHFDEEED